MAGTTISELAKACGVGVPTVRYYERRGLLADPRPRKQGYRKFDDDDARRLTFVRQAQGLGFTLKEIADLPALRVAGSTTCSDVRSLADTKLREIDEKLRTLRAFRDALASLMAQCARRGPRSQCPIVDAIEQQEPAPKRRRAPRRVR